MVARSATSRLRSAPDVAIIPCGIDRRHAGLPGTLVFGHFAKPLLPHRTPRYLSRESHRLLHHRHWPRVLHFVPGGIPRVAPIFDHGFLRRTDDFLYFLSGNSHAPAGGSSRVGLRGRRGSRNWLLTHDLCRNSHGGLHQQSIGVVTAWTQLGPTVLASFMASLVECVEALTVVLAVGTLCGWRYALGGTAAALGVLLLMVVGFGRSLAQIPVPIVQFLIGTLVLLFGLRWLRKAILRAAGIIPIHDEAAEYAKQAALLQATVVPGTKKWDRSASIAAFKIVMLEGIEVVFIVVAIAANGRLLVAATMGAVAALCLVVLLGLWLHRPLSKVPENALKFSVGVLLAAFGTLWVGESLHLRWPQGDFAIFILVAGYFLLAQTLVRICRRSYSQPLTSTKAPTASVQGGLLQYLLRQFVALFVDDSALAGGIIAWVLMAWWGASHSSLSDANRCTVLFLGFASLLGFSALRASKT